MNRPNKVLTFIALLVVMLVSGVAATPASPVQPGQPIATATANAGELLVTWDASAGATFYSVGWAEEEGIRQMLGAGREWLDAFHYAVIPAAYTSYTVSGLKPETQYYTIIGAQSSRFGATDLVWGTWSDLVNTGAEPETSCLTDGTCLPIQSLGTFSGSGNSATDIVNLTAGLYRFTGSRSNTDGNFFIDVVEIASGKSRSGGIYGRGQSGGQKTLTIYNDDSSFLLQQGNYLLEVDADHDWMVTIEQIAVH